MPRKGREDQISRMMECMHTLIHELEHLLEGLYEEHEYFKNEIKERNKKV
jgi:uncharacterized protein Yka (UPF0111/DUF47 family)